jgi:hypothetical protein
MTQSLTPNEQAGTHDWDEETFAPITVCRRCATTWQVNGNKPCKGKMAKITLRGGTTPSKADIPEVLDNLFYKYRVATTNGERRALEHEIITTTLTQQRDELLAKLKHIGRERDPNDPEEMADYYHYRGYNQAIDQVQAIIKGAKR